jgi:antitoxin HicB
MPLIRNVAPRLREVRSHSADGVARVIFTVDGSAMVLLHGFVKKSRKMPASELRTSQQRVARLDEEWRDEATASRGGGFDEFLRAEGLLDDAEATTAKRVIAFQIAEEMKRARITKSEMAIRMKTSRPAVDRLLDPKNRSVTLSTLERAASAVGKKLRIELMWPLRSGLASPGDRSQARTCLLSAH